MSGTHSQSTPGSKNKQKFFRSIKTRRPGDLCTSLYKNSVELSQLSGCVLIVYFISSDILKDNTCKIAHLFTETKCKQSVQELRG